MQNPVKLEHDSFKQVMLHKARVVKLLSVSEMSGSAACSTTTTWSSSSGTNNWGYSLMDSKGLQHLTLHYSMLNSAGIQSLLSSPLPQDLTPPGYFWQGKGSCKLTDTAQQQVTLPCRKWSGSIWGNVTLMSFLTLGLAITASSSAFKGHPN